jgi:hypothetical protein
MYRMLSFELIETDPKSGVPASPRFRAAFYDYTNDRAVDASGVVNAHDVDIRETGLQPDPNEEEFQAAVAVLLADPKLGAAIRDNTLQPYPPMPPLVNEGKGERTLAVGLMPKDGTQVHEIVGVNMIKQSVVRFPSYAPDYAIAGGLACGPPSAGQSTTPRGTAGQFEVVISREGRELWRFTAIRPSVSSGLRGSAIDLVNVSYLGKRVLGRAHAPILNVEYERNACGPFRDWSYQEGMFVANGTDLAPGIRLCTQAPQTILDIESDSGNFRGVAIFDDKERVTLVTEMNAGWYRYLSEWNFYDDGTIAPRYGFGATDNSCVCAPHHHHVYWRLDFDIISSAGNRVFENNKGVVTQLTTESKRGRLNGTDRTWSIVNAVSGESALIIPGLRDSNFDKYGRYDLLFLRFNSNEFDDAVNCTSGCDTRANLDPFINGESIDSQDLVVWYGAHFTHADGLNSVTGLTGPHVQGPNLVLKKY